MTGHLEDLVSDFSVLHRVDDVGALPAVTFFALASRLAAYQGVMRVVVAGLAEEEEQGGVPAVPPAPVLGPGPQMVGASRVELESEPAFAGVFSFGSPGGG